MNPGSSRPCVVLHSTFRWLPQTQTWLYNQIRYLPPEVENHVVCERSENLDQFPFPHLYNLDNCPPWQRYWEKGLRKLGLHHHLPFVRQQAKRVKADMLHSHFGHLGWTNLAVAQQMGIPHVVTFYGEDVNRLPQQDPRWHDRYRRLFEQCDRVLCEGPFMANSVVKLGCPPDKVQVHHLGISLDQIAFQPRTWQPGEPLRVLIAASFREKKGIPDALAALGQLQTDLPLEITIIGDASNDPASQLEKEKILTAIAQYQLKPRLLGYQSHATFFAAAYQHHVFLSPSVTASNGDTEGGAPVSIIEAVATGMPVVSTRHCDIPEVLRNPHRELLAAERDIPGLVNQLLWLTEHPQAWHHLVQAGRAHIEAEFDARVQGQRLATIYRNLITKTERLT